MSAAPSLIVDRWIKEGKLVVYKFAPVTVARTVKPGKELVIASEDDLRCKQGVLFQASGFLTSPKAAIRFQSPDFDTGDRFRIDTSLESGENMANNALWARGPPDTPFYTVVLLMPYTWLEWARVTIVNLDDAELTVLQSVYLAALWRGEWVARPLPRRGETP